MWGRTVWNIWDDVAWWTDQQSEESRPNHRLIKQYYLCFVALLPCRHCRETYQQFARSNSITFPVTKWLWKLHQAVNRHCNKPKCMDVSYETYIKRLCLNEQNSAPRCFWLVISWCVYTAQISKRMEKHADVQRCLHHLLGTSSILIDKIYNDTSHLYLVDRLQSESPMLWLPHLHNWLRENMWTKYSFAKWKENIRRTSGLKV